MCKKAIFLFDRTGYMAQPWLDNGYTCYLFDGQHAPGVTREGNLIKVGMWFKPYALASSLEEIKSIVGDGVCFVAGFPECTDLTVAGARWFEAKRAVNPCFQIEAALLATFPAIVANEYKAPFMVENPVSVLSTLWRKPDHIFHPWEYGGYLPEDDSHPTYPEYIKPRDAYPKKTCLWVGNGFVMPEKKPVAVEPGYSDQYHRLGGKSLKTKNVRSATPRGFAQAVYEANHKADFAEPYLVTLFRKVKEFLASYTELSTGYTEKLG